MNNHFETLFGWALGFSKSFLEELDEQELNGELGAGDLYHARLWDLNLQECIALCEDEEDHSGESEFDLAKARHEITKTFD